MPGIGIGSGTAFRQDILANRPLPEPSIEGFFFFATDINNGTFYQCTGTSWVAITNGLRALTAGTGINIVNTPTTITINNAYSLPIASASVLGGVKVGTNLSIDFDGVLSGPPGFTLTDATTSVLGGVILDRNPSSGHPISITKYGLHRVPAPWPVTDYGIFMGDDDTDQEDSSFLYVSTVNNPGVDVLNYFNQGHPKVRLSSEGQLLLSPGAGVSTPVSAITLWVIDNSNATSFALDAAGPSELMRLVNNYNGGKTFLVDQFANLFMGGTIGSINGVALTNGQLLIGKTSTGKMSVATLTAGTGISVTNGAGSITIAASGGYQLIQEIVVPPSSTQASFDFTSIPSTYRSLILEIIGGGTDTGADTSTVKMQFNGDTGSNYNYMIFYGVITNLSGGASNVQQVYSQNVAYINVGLVSLPAWSSTAGRGTIKVDFLDYANTSIYKNIRAKSYVHPREGTFVAGNDYMRDTGGAWLSTAAINSIKLFLNFGSWSEGSKARLYGV